MTLIDIGNTTANICEFGYFSAVALKDFKPKNYKNKVFYISVNPSFSIFPENFINLEPYFRLKSSYIGLGIDRIASCYYIKNGVIIDAGSAITVDKMRDGEHLGGFILPGLKAFLASYKQISTRLDYQLNTQINLDLLPNSTQEAISYGILKSIITSISDFAGDELIYLTGGDSSYLNQFFKTAISQKDLIFCGMKKLIDDLNL